MAKLNLSEVALPTESIDVDDTTYQVTAMPATEGLKFMEKYQEAIDTGKADLATMRQVICKYVTKDGMAITEKSFDTIFARKYGHLQKLYQEVLVYNFADVFQQPDSEE